MKREALEMVLWEYEQELGKLDPCSTEWFELMNEIKMVEVEIENEMV